MGIQVMNLKKMNNTGELTLYGDIGDDFFDEIKAGKIVNDLKELDVENITVNINSNGGGTSAAIAIANALKRHKAKITANIDGIVASAATIITSACDVVNMPKNALFMIHNPWTIAMGEEKDFERMAEVLGKVKNSIIETYVDKTGLEKSKLSELMDKESWFNAEEAKELGFIDNIIDNTEIEKIENRVISNGLVFNMAKFKNYKYFQKIKIENKEEEMDKIELKNKYPELYKEIFNDGVMEERNRLKELEEIGVNSETVNKAKFEEPKTANEIAFDLIKEMKNKTEIVNNTVTTKVPEIKDYRNENPPLNNEYKGKADDKKATFMDVNIDLIISKMNKEEK